MSAGVGPAPGKATHIAAVEALTSFKFDSTTPFGGEADELADHALGLAYALSIVVSNSLDGKESGSGDFPTRNYHLARAADAIGVLLALSSFAREAV